MVVKIFVWALLSLAVISYFIPVEIKDQKVADKDIALLTFTDSIMYTLSQESMNRIVKSKEAIRYRDKDVMHIGDLTLKDKDKEGNEITDILLSDIIIKRGDDFTFINNVKFTRNDYVTLNTDELLYNAKTGIAKNSLPFNGTYFNNYIEGKNIYLDLNNYYMKSRNTHFEIEVQKGNK